MVAELTHPGRISSKPVPLCVRRLNARIGNKPHNDHRTERTCGSGLEGGKIPGGKVLMIKVANDGCSDHRVLSACSSKARQVHASDTRLLQLPRERQWSAMICVNSLISIIGCGMVIVLCKRGRGRSAEVGFLEAQSLSVQRPPAKRNHSLDHLMCLALKYFPASCLRYVTMPLGTV